MPSSWNVYYVIFLSAVLALVIPATLAGISLAVSPKRARSSDAPAPSILEEKIRLNQTVLGKRINARIFLGMNSALLLLTLMLALIPCAGMLQVGISRIALSRALIAMVTITGLAALGLLYSVRKGDLSWLTSIHPEDRPK